MPTTDINKNLIDKLAAMGADAPETRSRRVQVLITPTMHETLKELSNATGVSVNGIINAALSDYLNQGK